MLWKKKSRFDDLAPLGWMMLGAISAFTLVSLVNSVPEEKINYSIKKMSYLLLGCREYSKEL